MRLSGQAHSHSPPCQAMLSLPTARLRLFHLDLKHKQKLGHEPQETRSPWSHWEHGMEERGGDEWAGREVPSKIRLPLLNLSPKLECQCDGQGSRD